MFELDRSSPVLSGRDAPRHRKRFHQIARAGELIRSGLLHRPDGGNLLGAELEDEHADLRILEGWEGAAGAAHAFGGIFNLIAAGGSTDIFIVAVMLSRAYGALTTLKVCRDRR